MSIFIKIEGPSDAAGVYTGESQDADHQGWIVCTSFSYGNGRKDDSGGGGTPQERRMADLAPDEVVIGKEVDAATVPLSKAMVNAVQFAKLHVHLTAAYTDDSGTSGRRTYLKFVFINAALLNFSLDADPDSPPKEELKLNFEEMTLQYFKFSDAGKLIDQPSYHWITDHGKTT